MKLIKSMSLPRLQWKRKNKGKKKRKISTNWQTCFRKVSFVVAVAIVVFLLENSEIKRGQGK